MYRIPPGGRGSIASSRSNVFDSNMSVSVNRNWFVIENIIETIQIVRSLKNGNVK